MKILKYKKFANTDNYDLYKIQCIWNGKKIHCLFVPHNNDEIIFEEIELIETSFTKLISIELNSNEESELEISQIGDDIEIKNASVNWITTDEYKNPIVIDLKLDEGSIAITDDEIPKIIESIKINDKVSVIIAGLTLWSY